MPAMTFDSLSPMPAAAVPSPSSRARWAGRILTGLAAAFLLFDLGMKLSGAKEAVAGTVQLGWQPHHLPILGMIQLVCLIVYLIPRTAPLGAVLWTGYLGGAVATHLRLDNPLVSHTLFPVYVAVLVWGGLYLRDARVRALFGAAR
jgi:DoxX-like family